MKQNVVNASKKRIALATYLDLCIFMTIWGLLTYFFAGDRVFPIWVPFVIFLAIKMITRNSAGAPGLTFLSMNKAYQVDAQIKNQESWLTMTLALLMVVEGTQSLVRWAHLPIIQPYFGFIPEPSLYAFISMVIGILCITTGYYIFKLSRRGLQMGIGLSIAYLISTIMSWSLWDQTAAEIIVARRMLIRGEQVPPGEIEALQSVMPEGLIVIAGIFLFCLIKSRKRLVND